MTYRTGDLSKVISEELAILQQLKNNIGAKYPVLKNKMDWIVVHDYIKGYRKNHPEENICRLFVFIEGYAKWLNELETLKGYLKDEFIEFRIKILNEALSFLSSDNELLKLAEKEMKPIILKQLGEVKALLNDNDKNVSIENKSVTISDNEIGDQTNTLLLNGAQKPIVKSSTISKAVYHSGLLGEHTGHEIAEWIFEHCHVVLNDDSETSIGALAKSIRNVKSDPNRRGRKYNLKAELQLLCELPKLE